MRSRRLPSPGTQPPTTTSWRVVFLIFSHDGCAPPRLVLRVQALGDDALEALLLGGREQLLTVADDVVGHAPAPAVAELELGQARAALGVGQVHERVPVEPQQVEDDVGDRRLLGQAPDGRLRADVHAPLQRAEARLALGVEGDDLAVEHRAVVAERAVEAADLGIARGDVEQVARVQAHAARLGVADGAHAVPLDLEGPVLVVARQRAGARHHRDDLLGHGRARRLVGGRVHAVDHPVLGLLVLVDRERARSGPARARRAGAPRSCAAPT